VLLSWGELPPPTVDPCAATSLLGTSGATLLPLSGARTVLLLPTAALIGFNLVSRRKRDLLVTFVSSIAAPWVAGFCVLQVQQALHSPSKRPLVLGAIMIPLVEGLASSHLHEFLCRPRMRYSRGQSPASKVDQRCWAGSLASIAVSSGPSIP